MYKDRFLRPCPARNGIEMACWGIAAKSLNAPLHALLGGEHRNSLRIYANGWYRGPRDPVSSQIGHPSSPRRATRRSSSILSAAHTAQWTAASPKSFASGWPISRRCARWRKQRTPASPAIRPKARFCTAVNAHLHASIPNFLIQESFDDFLEPWTWEVISGTPWVRDGYVPVPSTPGIGIDIDEQKAKEDPYSDRNFLSLFKEGWETRT